MPARALAIAMVTAGKMAAAAAGLRCRSATSLARSLDFAHAERFAGHWRRDASGCKRERSRRGWRWGGYDQHGDPRVIVPRYNEE